MPKESTYYAKAVTHRNTVLYEHQKPEFSVQQFKRCGARRNSFSHSSWFSVNFYTDLQSHFNMSLQLSNNSLTLQQSHSRLDLKLPLQGKVTMNRSDNSNADNYTTKNHTTKITSNTHTDTLYWKTIISVQEEKENEVLNPYACAI